MKVLAEPVGLNTTAVSIPDTNLSVSEYETYDPSVIYSVGARVTLNGRDYESIVAANQSNNPEQNPDKWVLVGASNLFRLLDKQISSRAKPTTSDLTKPFTFLEADGTITLYNTGGVVFGERGGIALTVIITTAENRPLLIDSVALVSCFNARLIRLRASSGAVTKYYECDCLDVTPEEQEYKGINPETVRNYKLEIDTVVLTQSSPALRLDIVILPEMPASGVPIQSVPVCSIGEFVFGKIIELGRAKYSGVTTGFQDFSRVERDDFGNVSVSKRSYARRVNVPFIISKSRAPIVNQVVADSRATPRLYTYGCHSGTSSVYGIHQDFNVTYEDYDHVVGDIEILGLAE